MSGDGNPRFPCGIEQGPTWSSSGRTGSTWYVASITDRSECAKSAAWAAQLGARIVGSTGDDVQSFRADGYGCVLVRSQLQIACYVGEGGLGVVGVFVVGDPARSPLVPSSAQPDPPPPPTPTTGLAPPVATDPAAGVPTGFVEGARCGQGGVDHYAGRQWEFRLADGTRVRGSNWTVNTFSFFSDATCSTIRPLIPMLADSVSRSHSPAVTSVESWGCVSATTSDSAVLPLAGCARSIFPTGVSYGDGTPSLAPRLEQVIVSPDTTTGAGTVSPADGGTLVPFTTAQARSLSERMSAVQYDIRNFGVTFVALNWVTAQDHLSGTTALATSKVGRACGGTPSGYWPATPVPSAPWVKRSDRGNTWTLATAGGYPCVIAAAVFGIFLPNLVISSGAASLAASQLDRYGWSCVPNPASTSAVCSLSPSRSADFLTTGLGRPLPTAFRVGVAAAFPHEPIDRIKTIIDATLVRVRFRAPRPVIVASPTISRAP